MNTKFLANAFGVWNGWAYLYCGNIPQDTSAIAHITVQVSQLLNTVDFISSVIQVQGQYYVYVKTALPVNENFETIGNLEPEYVELVQVEETSPDDEDVNQGDQ